MFISSYNSGLLTHQHLFGRVSKKAECNVVLQQLHQALSRDTTRAPTAVARHCLRDGDTTTIVRRKENGAPHGEGEGSAGGAPIGPRRPPPTAPPARQARDITPALRQSIARLRRDTIAPLPVLTVLFVPYQFAVNAVRNLELNYNHVDFESPSSPVRVLDAPRHACGVPERATAAAGFFAAIRGTHQEAHERVYGLVQAAEAPDRQRQPQNA